MPASELDVQREQFHRELMRKSMRIAELELQLQAVHDRYERALSWRMTRPLRLGQRVWRRVRAPKPG